MIIQRTTLLFFALGVAAWAAEPAGQWAQWRGPQLNGSSATAHNLPVSWTEKGNVQWRTELPSWAAATPIVWEDYIFVTSAHEDFASTAGSGVLGQAINRIKSMFSFADQLLLLALDRKDGSVRWRADIGKGNEIRRKQNMASPSPVTDGRRVWVITGTGTLTCLDFSGARIWQRHLQDDYGPFGLAFGYASSPLLDQGRLYVQVLHGMNTDDPSYLLAINAETGETIWKVERPTDAVHESPDSYTTPTIAEADGRRLLIVSGADYVTGHDLASGEELWRAGGLNPNKARNYRIIASPLAAGNMIFVPTRRQPFLAFRLAERNEPPVRVWSTDYGPDVPTPTTDGERLYIVDDRGIALCLRMETGETVWDRSRLEPGTYSASPVLADGMIYAINEDGSTTVIRAGKEFEILSVNKLNDYTLASPAVAGEQIFIRTSQYLYCIAKGGSLSD